MAVRLLGSGGTIARGEEASTTEVCFKNSAGEVEEEGQETEGFHGLLAATETGTGVGAEKVAVVLVVVLGFEDERSQPTNHKCQHRMDRYRRRIVIGRTGKRR